MKILFFLVIIINITLFMWEYKTGAFAQAIVTTAQQAADQEPIVLLSELKPALPDSADTNNQAPASIKTDSEQPAPEKIEAKIEANIEEVPMRCYEAGPFTHQTDYQYWISAMADKYTVEPLSKDEQTAGRYIVLLPASTPREMESSLQLLKKHGISDFFMRRTEDGNKELSLGVFSSEGRAAIMQQQMLAKGVNAQIKPEYKTKPQKYLFIKTDNNPLELLTNLQKSYPQLSVRDSECR